MYLNTYRVIIYHKIEPVCCEVAVNRPRQAKYIGGVFMKRFFADEEEEDDEDFEDDEDWEEEEDEE